MKRSLSLTIGLVLAGLLGLADLALGWLGGPPLPVILIGGVLGAATLVGVILAWRTGSRPAIVTIIVTRLLSALTAVPAFIVDGVPGPAKLVAAVAIAVTVLATALLATSWRPRPVTVA